MFKPAAIALVLIFASCANNGTHSSKSSVSIDDVRTAMVSHGISICDQESTEHAGAGLGYDYSQWEIGRCPGGWQVRADASHTPLSKQQLISGGWLEAWNVGEVSVSVGDMPDDELSKVHQALISIGAKKL